jgi:hypothetical protein
VWAEEAYVDAAAYEFSETEVGGGRGTPYNLISIPSSLFRAVEEGSGNAIIDRRLPLLASF